jgi:sugar/nucleoside kinase (ribokinase family)
MKGAETMCNEELAQAAIDFDAIAQKLQRATDFERNGKRPVVAVIGDYCLDKYLYLYPSLDEASVETGKTAFQVRATRLFAGVGGTIANNLCALGAETHCFGVIGNDGEGFDLTNALRKIGANVDGLVVSDKVLTSAYMKPMRPDPETNPERVDDDGSPLPRPGEGAWVEGHRLDIRNPTPIASELVDELQKRFLEKVATFDAVVVSDQFPIGSEALFSPAFRSFLSEVALANPRVFFLCDSRFFIDSYRNMLVKCNASEALDACDSALDGKLRRETTLDRDSDADLDAILRAGRRIAQRNRRPVLVTRGAVGSLLFLTESDAPSARVQAIAIPSNPVEPPIDVCGAGDASNAGLAFARSLGLSLPDAAYLANVVSSITIKRIGETGTASVPEILEILQNK